MQSCNDGMLDGSWDALDRFAVEVQPDPHGVRLVLAGELDMAATPELDRVLYAVTDGLQQRLLIDLHAVRFMDSTGLASLVRARRAADTNGHQLAVRPGSLQVQRLFELTGMLDRFTFED